ncbi:Target of Nesh-SH3, partial [Manacus vitellinus]
SQLILSDNKKLVPVTIIKQVIQNRTQPKTPDSSSLPGAILVPHIKIRVCHTTYMKECINYDYSVPVKEEKKNLGERKTLPSRSTTSGIPEMPPISSAATSESILESFTPKTSRPFQWPRVTLAPKDTRPGPSKPKTSPSPRVPPTRASPKESRRVPSKPRASPAPDVPHTKPASKEPQYIPFKPKATPIPDAPHRKPAIHQTTPQPIITKSSTTTGHSKATMAPHKTRLPSARPKPSDKSQTRPVFSKTTLAPARTKAPGLPQWIAPTTGRAAFLGGFFILSGKDMNVTFSNHLEPCKIFHCVLLQNLIPQSTILKPDILLATIYARDAFTPDQFLLRPCSIWTVEYSGLNTSASKNSKLMDDRGESFLLLLAPHVKYMKKDDDVPCSITSSLEHFPQEEAGSKEEPTRPPQNPPTNLTVVTVEGCPTFVILDWEKPDNDTVTEYEVVSTENGGSDGEKEKSIITTNQTHSTVENLKPDTSYEFHVKPRNPLGEGPSSNVVSFSTESADPRVSEPISMGKDAIWTEIPFNSDTYSECKGKQYVKRTWYKKFVGVQLCNSLRYKIYLSDSLTGKFYNIGDQRGHGEDHCQFVDSFLDGRTGQQEDLPVKDGFFRAVRQEPVKFGKIGGETQINYVRWYECGTSIPGKW